MLEAVIQSECVRWFRLNYPQFAHCFFKIDNEGKRNPRRAAVALAMGLVAGIPDTFLSVASCSYHGAYFEFKQHGEKLKPKQVDRIALLRSQGYFVDVIESKDQFETSVNNYLNCLEYRKTA